MRYEQRSLISICDVPDVVRERPSCTKITNGKVQVAGRFQQNGTYGLARIRRARNCCLLYILEGIDVLKHAIRTIREGTITDLHIPVCQFCVSTERFLADQTKAVISRKCNAIEGETVTETMISNLLDSCWDLHICHTLASTERFITDQAKAATLSKRDTS